jgi:hypothetical protein
MRVWACVALAVCATPCLGDTLLLTSGEKLIGKIVAEESASVGSNRPASARCPCRATACDSKRGPVAGTPPPGAQEAVAPAVAPGEAVAQATAPPAPEKKKEDLLRLYWDQGLRYQFYQPITVPVPFTQGERTIGEEVRISGQAGLKLSLDAAAYHSSDREQQIPDATAVRQFAL